MSLAERLLKGEVLAASRLISDIDERRIQPLASLRSSIQKQVRPTLSASPDLRARGKVP